MEQMSVYGRLRTLNGCVLVVTYTFCRVAGCSGLCWLGALDLYSFAPLQPMGWAAAAGGLLCLGCLTLMSWCAC